jgi:plasmid maintenance system antidote protein VapI
MTKPPTRRTARKKPAPRAELAPVAPELAAALVAYANNPEAMRAELGRLHIDPERVMPALTALRGALEERGRLAAQALELHQQAIAVDPKRPVTAPGELRQVLAKNLRVRMAELDITQTRLSALSGVSQNHLGKIEKGETDVGIDVIEKIARALGISAAQLLTRR